MRLSRFPAYLFLAALIGLSWSQTILAQDPLAPSLAVSQSRLELELNPTRPQGFDSVAVLNVGSEPQAILVSLSHWDLDEANLFRALPPSPQSLDQWMVVNPLRFTLNPGESQTVRFAVRPRVVPEPGEHRAMVFFNQDPDAEINSGKTLVFNIGIPIYTYVGDYWRTTQIDGFELIPDDNNQTAKFVISATNSGNAHSRAQGFFGYWKRDNFPGKDTAVAMLRDEKRIREEGQASGMIYYNKLNSVALLPGTTREIITDVILPAEAGEYYLVVSAQFGDAEIAELLEL